MIRVVFGIFIILHGLVHLLYFALSRQLFDLDTPLVGWPERSWAFSPLMTETGTRSLASMLYLVATALFVLCGLAILFNVSGWQMVLIGTGIFASVVTVLFWDGQMQRLPDKGFIGVLINIAVIAAPFLFERFSIAL